jgi:hypothetical protein
MSAGQQWTIVDASLERGFVSGAYLIFKTKDKEWLLPQQNELRKLFKVG